MRYVPAIIIAIAIILTPIIWHVASSFRAPAVDGMPAVDSSARIEIAEMQVEIAQLKLVIEDFRTEIAGLRAQIARGTQRLQPEVSDADGQTGIDTSAYPDVVLIGDRRKINTGLTVVSSSFLSEFLGRPREDLSDRCQPMTNESLLGMLETATVASVKVRLLRPAVESLERVFEQIRLSDGELYRRINTAGSLCVRRIRGSQISTSSHAYGLAIDLNINGVLDTLGDGKTQLGLTIIADFFRDEGWIWGAAFSREDSMHFEVSRELLERWRSEGKI